MKFNGESKDFVTVLKRNRPMRAPRRHNILTVPKMAGGYYQSTTVDPLEITVDILIEAYDHDDLLRKAEEVVEWLSVDKPAPLSFPDDPFRMYYASVEGELDPEEIVTFSKVTVSFLCPDAYKYGLEHTYKFLQGIASFNNKGTAPSEPIITVRPTENVTHIDIMNHLDEYVRFGRPIAIDDNPVEAKTRIFNHELNTMVGWTNADEVDSGVVSGSMSTSGYNFYANDFGTGTGWHGPAKKTSITGNNGGLPIQDFLLEVDMRNELGNLDQIGRIEVAVLDENNNQMGKVMLAKYEQGTKRMYARLQAGDESENWKLINNHGEDEGTWKKFDGRLKLSREGNKWYAWIGWWDAERKVYNRRDVGRWTDELGTFTAPIAQVQVYIARFGDKPYTTMRAEHIKVWRYNENLANAIPYVAGPGDEVRFDFKDKNIFLNGESVFDERITDNPNQSLSPGSKFFPVHPGDNELYIFPSEAAEGEVDYQERYK